MPPSILSTSIFEHAEKFFAAISHLHTAGDQQIGAIAAPAMVIAAFASELYLKCFICREKGSVPRGHYLHDLYTQLSQSSQAAIERHWDAITQDHDEVLNSIDRQEPRPLPRGLDDALREGNQAFERLRYIYEVGSDLRFVLSDLPIALRRALIDIESTWGQQDGMPIGLSYPRAITVGVRRKGSVAFWINNPTSGWATDSNQYNFGPQVRAAGINISVFKTPDRRISITIGGPLGRTFRFNHPIPRLTSPNGLHIAITWAAQSVILYFDGKPAVTVNPILEP